MVRYGMIDIGSNTVRIVIYGLIDEIQYHELWNEKESVRLRQYLKDDILTEDGIAKLIVVLNRYKAIEKRFKMVDFTVFATQTIRMAKNSQDVLSRVKEETGYDIRILSEDEECLLGFQGMKTYLKHQEEGLYVDLGGGSMELVYFKNDEPVHYHSLDFGSIVLRSMIPDPIPNKKEMKTYKKFAIDQFDKLPWLKGLGTPLIVVGGSSRNMARIDKYITKRDESAHGYTMKLEQIRRTRKLLQLLTIEEIENIEGVSDNRADILIPSIFMFELLYKYVKSPYYVCSGTALREGVLIERIYGK
jgi:exopolyphosphatase/guanosine-5'-triphosphate,3'-diphosphate pyrophosphatase